VTYFGRLFSMSRPIMIASEPLTRDTTTWLEVPEYSMVYADTRRRRPTVEVHYLD